MSDTLPSVERVLLPSTAHDETEFLVDVERYHFACGYVARMRVLDIACGAGWGTALLVSRGRAISVVGIDIDAATAVFARKRHGSEVVQFVLSSAERIPLRDSSVDVAVSIETIEHVRDPQRLLRELARVVVPGGKVVISTPRNEKPERMNPSNCYHIREYSSAEFESMLRSVFPSVELYSQVTTYADDLVPLPLTKSTEWLRRTFHALVSPSLRAAVRKKLGSKGLTIKKSTVVAGVHTNSVVQLAVCQTANLHLKPTSQELERPVG